MRGLRVQMQPQPVERIAGRIGQDFDTHAGPAAEALPPQMQMFGFAPADIFVIAFLPRL